MKKDTLTRKVAESGKGLELTGSITYPANLHGKVEPLAAKMKQLFEWCLSWGQQKELDLTTVPQVTMQNVLVRCEKPGKGSKDFQFVISATRTREEDRATLFAAMDAGNKCEVIVRIPPKKKAAK